MVNAVFLPGREAASAPPPGLVLPMARAAGFAILYGLGIGLALAVDMLLAGRVIGEKLAQAIPLFAAAAGLTGLLAWPLASLLAGRRPATARFAAMTAFLIAGTAGASTLFFYLQRLSQFGLRAAVPFTELWLDTIFHTSASSTYLFAVTGPRLFLPLGLPVIFAAALAFAATEPDRR